MNNITQKTIFDYEEIEILGDLERLVLFLDNIEATNFAKLFKMLEVMVEMITLLEQCSILFMR